MWRVDSYLSKADQFARLAKDATEPHNCTYYEETRNFWLQLAAEQAKRDEEIHLTSKPK